MATANGMEATWPWVRFWGHHREPCCEEPEAPSWPRAQSAGHREDWAFRKDIGSAGQGWVGAADFEASGVTMSDHHGGPSDPLRFSEERDLSRFLPWLPVKGFT